MTKYFLVTILCLFYLMSQGQTKADLIGRWDPVFVSGDGFYYNFKTDSSFFSKELESHFSDSLARKERLINFKNLYGSFQLSFEKNDTFKQYINNFLVFGGKYKLIPSKNTILLTGNNSANKEDVKLNCYYKDQVLFISFRQIDDGTEYVLERQQK